MQGHPLASRFAAAMERLGPFEPAPLLAVAVSGGADSLALAILADGWARAQGGTVIGLVVDHGLRPASRAEADLTLGRLSQRHIPARLLPIVGLARGPGLAARARTERYRVLVDACAALGCLHLLLGHHSTDQAETLMMRVLGNSGSAGLAGMPALSERATIRLLRPLLTVDPAELRALLRAEGLAWVEDPSNRDPAALRARLRMGRPDGVGNGVADPGGPASADALLSHAAAAAARARARAETEAARVLAARVSLRPEGFALLSPGRIHPDALAALLQAVAGASFPPATEAVGRLAAEPRAATLAGVRMVPAGRFGPGWLLVREAKAMQPDIPARRQAVWDGRFRLNGSASPGTRLGALGDGAVRFRSRTGLPAAVLRTLPGLKDGLMLVAVPHLAYYVDDCAGADVLLSPPRPIAGGPFWPALSSRESCG